MEHRMPNTTDMTPRRGFIRRIAGTMALGLGALAGPARAQPLAPLDDESPLACTIQGVMQGPICLPRNPQDT
jgi:hypothetical protein